VRGKRRNEKKNKKYGAYVSKKSCTVRSEDLRYKDCTPRAMVGNSCKSALADVAHLDFNNWGVLQNLQKKFVAHAEATHLQHTDRPVTKIEATQLPPAV